MNEPHAAYRSRKRVALGTTRAAKLSALRAATTRIGEIDERWRDCQIVSRAVESNVPAMPINDWQMIEGAKRRAQNLRRVLEAEDAGADFYVGLEGGFHSLANGKGGWLTFLRGWAYVTDGEREGLGATPSILVPKEIAERVLRERRELSEVIDEAANDFDVRSRQGAWGVLTRELITRPQTFEVALVAAFAPFYNEGFYKS